MLVNSGMKKIVIGGFKSSRTEADCGKFKYEVSYSDKNGQSFEAPPIFYYN